MYFSTADDTYGIVLNSLAALFIGGLELKSFSDYRQNRKKQRFLSVIEEEFREETDTTEQDGEEMEAFYERFARTFENLF